MLLRHVRQRCSFIAYIAFKCHAEQSLAHDEVCVTLYVGVFFLACTTSHSRAQPTLCSLAAEMGVERIDVSIFEAEYELLYIYDVAVRKPRLHQP